MEFSWCIPSDITSHDFTNSVAKSTVPAPISYPPDYPIYTCISILSSPSATAIPSPIIKPPVEIIKMKTVIMTL
jgi:hypothetical protein